MWLFEWNWLGYLWTFSAAGVVLLIGGTLSGEVASRRETGRGQTGADIVVGFAIVGFVAASCLLGVLTIFVWNFMTAILLVGGALCLLALMLGIAWLRLRRISNR